MQGIEILAADFDAVLALEPEQIVAVLLRVLIEDLRLVVWLADRACRQVKHNGIVGEKREVSELEVVKSGMEIVDEVVVISAVPIEDVSRGRDGRVVGLAGIGCCLRNLCPA